MSCLNYYVGWLFAIIGWELGRLAFKRMTNIKLVKITKSKGRMILTIPKRNKFLINYWKKKGFKIK